MKKAVSWRVLAVVLTLCVATIASAISTSQSVVITATVGGSIVTIEPESGSGGGGTRVLPTGIVTFYGTTSPGGTVIVSQVGGLSVTVVADGTGVFSGSLVVDADRSSKLIFTPILPSGQLGISQEVSLLVPSGYVTTVDRIMLTQEKQNNTEVSVSESQATAVVGDCDQDAVVDQDDFAVVRYWYGQRTFPTCADLNADGAITLQDFSLLAYRWQK